MMNYDDIRKSAGALGQSSYGGSMRDESRECSVSTDQCSQAPEPLEQTAKRTQEHLVQARTEHDKAITNLNAAHALTAETAKRLDQAARDHQRVVMAFLQSVGLTEIR